MSYNLKTLARRLDQIEYPGKKKEKYSWPFNILWRFLLLVIEKQGCDFLIFKI